jgi:hypothetical protein
MSLSGGRHATGALDTGKVEAHKSGRVTAHGATVRLRRLPVALPQPTRDGETASHVLRHVPRRQASAQQRAERAGKRWTLATLWPAVPATWTWAGHALGDPKAALCGCGLAWRASKAVAVRQAALRAVDGHATVRQGLAAYERAGEISPT